MYGEVVLQEEVVGLPTTITLLVPPVANPVASDMVSTNGVP